MNRRRPSANAACSLRQIALYPLQGDALLALCVFTLAGMLAWLPGAGGVFALITYFAAYKYAFELLLATGNGRDAAPILVVDAPTGAVWRLLAVLLVLLTVGLYCRHADMPGTALLLLAAFVWLQPALLLALATGDGLWRALNPATAWQMAARIGAPYFAVMTGLFLFQALPLVAGKMLVPYLPGFVAALLVDAAFYWGLFASFHLLGCVLYRYHEELGHVPARHQEALLTPRAQDQTLLEHAARIATQGDLQAALALLRETMRERAVGLDVHARYRQLLLETGDAATAETHAGHFLTVLLLEKHERRALGLLHEIMATNPGFTPPDPEHGNLLAARACDAGQCRLAVSIWQALLRADPRHPQASQWALQAAQVLQHRLDAPADAATVLRSAREACREDAQRAQLEAALALLPPGMPA
ncbi:MAG: hypothetical protein KGL91_12140 [Xanthomonadaceae bacterium]|nr:hypothetical protein [Xanthomonadaceae bacterium]